MKTFTRKELLEFDGSVPGRPVLIAYRGRVYDVTGSFPWHGGVHWACVRAGLDLTDRLAEAPHGAELLDRVPCVGILADYAPDG